VQLFVFELDGSAGQTVTDTCIFFQLGVLANGLGQKWSHQGHDLHLKAPQGQTMLSLALKVMTSGVKVLCLGLQSLFSALNSLNYDFFST